MGSRPRDGNTTARGYGWHHQQIRAQWAPQVAAGLVDCWRCGKRIPAGAPWDLGHDDHDRRLYRGPEHRECNRATATRRDAPADPQGRAQTRW